MSANSEPWSYLNQIQKCYIVKVPMIRLNDIISIGENLLNE